jgi:hypothetical protein
MHFRLTHLHHTVWIQTERMCLLPDTHQVVTVTVNTTAFVSLSIRAHFSFTKFELCWTNVVRYSLTPSKPVAIGRCFV